MDWNLPWEELAGRRKRPNGTTWVSSIILPLMTCKPGLGNMLQNGKAIFNKRCFFLFGVIDVSELCRAVTAQ